MEASALFDTAAATLLCATAVGGAYLPWYIKANYGTKATGNLLLHLGTNVCRTVMLSDTKSGS